MNPNISFRDGMNSHPGLYMDLGKQLRRSENLRDFYREISIVLPRFTVDKLYQYESHPERLLDDISNMIISLSAVCDCLAKTCMQSFATRIREETGLGYPMVRASDPTLIGAKWGQLAQTLKWGMPPDAMNVLKVAFGTQDPLGKLTSQGLITSPNKSVSIKPVQSMISCLCTWRYCEWYEEILTYEKFLIELPSVVPVNTLPVNMLPVTVFPAAALVPVAKPAGRVRGAAKLRTVDPLSSFLVIASGDAEDPAAGLHSVVNDPILSEDVGIRFVSQEARESYYKGMELGVYHLISESKAVEEELKLQTHAKVLGEKPATATENKQTTVQLSGETRGTSRTVTVTVGGKQRTVTTGPLLPEFLIVTRGAPRELGDGNVKAIYEPVVQNPPPSDVDEYCELSDLLKSQDKEASYGVYMILTSNKRDIPATVREVHAKLVARKGN